MIVYADNAATTRVDEEVKNFMDKHNDVYGNPSSLHKLGAQAKSLIDKAREQIAAAINAHDFEVYFTSGGSESNNLAILGFAYANKNKGHHIITSSIEHPSVAEAMKFLERDGFEITYVGVNSDGVIKIDELKNSIRDDTILISIMFANNEIGTIQPIHEIGSIARRRNICFHTDAVQALGSISIDVEQLNVDMLTLSGHKIYAPKGIGVLYVKSGTRLSPLIHGGGQERGIRNGTENTISIAAMGKATELCVADMEHNNNHLLKLRNRFINEVETKISGAKLNGHRTQRLSGNVNFSFEGIDGESLVLMLNMKGICVSSASACFANSLSPSHVISSIGVPDNLAHGTIRFSFGKYNTEKELGYIMGILPEAINKLRGMMI